MAAVAVLAPVIGLFAPSSAGASNAPPAGSWPMAGYNAAHSNYNAAEKTLNSATVGKLKLQRTFTMPSLTPTGMCGYRYHEPHAAVVGDTMYAIAGDDVAAFNLSTGARLWHTPLNPSSQVNDYVDLAVKDGRVFVAGNRSTFDPNAPDPTDCDAIPADGNVWAFTATTGAALWTFTPADHQQIQHVSVTGSRIVMSSGGEWPGFTCPECIVTVSDAATGGAIWSKRGYESVLDTRLLVVGGVLPLYPTIGQDGGPLQALSLSDGRVLWTRDEIPLAGDTDGPTATDLYVKLSTSTLGVRALNPQTGAVKWTNMNVHGDVELDRMAVGKKRLITPCNDFTDWICALSRTDGHLLWKSKAAKYSLQSIIAADMLHLSGVPGAVLLASTGAPANVPGHYPPAAYWDNIVAGGRLIATRGPVIRVYATD